LQGDGGTLPPLLPPRLSTTCLRTLQATPVLHSLRLFFIDCFGRGDLSIKPPPAADASPAAVYAAWLHRQYTAYLAALLRLLGSAASGPRAQVAALLAAMECVRGERPGVFNNRLFHRLMTVLLTGAGVAPEVLGVLIARLLGKPRGLMNAWFARQQVVGSKRGSGTGQRVVG
jgi:hypothetical protein